MGVRIFIFFLMVILLANGVGTWASNEETPVSQISLPEEVDLKFSRSWRPPNYSEQDQNTTIGYSSNTFDIPKGMEKQVQFWIDIYSKYSTQQGVIHDADDISKVYEVVDFQDINENPDLTNFQKEKLKQKRVNEMKKQIALKENISKQDMDRVRFQLGLKDRMLEAIYFSGRYIPEMEEIFKSQNLPIELTRLPFVESSFNVMARSKVGASGIWQIMPYTARPYRLINSAVDKRNHPIEATKIAAKLLRINYNILQSWPLAISGYNHGASGIKRLTEKYKTREISELIDIEGKAKRFGFASRNFYATFLASLIVEKNANNYFPKVVWAQDLEAKELKLPTDIRFSELVKWFDGDKEKAKIFNPHLTQKAILNRVVIPKNTVIEIPKESYEEALILLSRSRGLSVADSRKSVQSVIDSKKSSDD